MTHKPEKPKEAKIIKLSDWQEKQKEKERQKLLKQILERGNPLK